MFEIGIFGVIALAISYWTVLWLMGRREDVLHGEFVEGKAEPVDAIAPEQQARPIFLERPARPASPERPVFPKRPTLPERPAPTAAPEQPAFRQERLESLLHSIKQDLDQLVRK